MTMVPDKYLTRVKMVKKFTELIAWLGDDPFRPELAQTPVRMLDAWTQMSRGYSQNVCDVIETMPTEGMSMQDQAIRIEDIDFFSLCEHHMLPFWGKVAIEYHPRGLILGFSKVSRVVDVFACRLQLQERLTQQVAESLWTHLRPLDLAVEIEATHICMSGRGVMQVGAKTKTIHRIKK